MGDRMGKPPGMVQTRWVVRLRSGEPDVLVSDSADVGRRLDADVMAMEMAVSIEDSLALSWRVNCNRCVFASTMAMLIGTPISLA